MKERLLEEVGLLIDDPDRLIHRLIGKHIAFAAWRLPQDNKSFFIIDLHSDLPMVKDQSIEELNNTFIINPFRENHPPQPKILNGDVVIHFQEGEPKITISPRVSGQSIEKLYEAISSTPEKSHEKGERIEPHAGDFIAMVNQALEEIKNGRMHKVVLSRFEEYPLREDFSPYQCLKALEDNYPNAFVYLTYTTDFGLWMGASPEKLISIKDQRIFRTESLAGTQYLPENVNLSEVAWTQKEIEEQAMVSRYIIDCLKKIRLREFEESGPKTIRAGKLVHLKTEYKVDMAETNMPELGSIMLNLLHPTSAVCGAPFEAAYNFISEHEGYDRSLYAGFLGPVNFHKDTDLFVNLRCMQLLGKKVRLYAGAGITEDSNPEKEYQETVNKMKTLSDLL